VTYSQFASICNGRIFRSSRPVLVVILALILRAVLRTVLALVLRTVLTLVLRTVLGVVHSLVLRIILTFVFVIFAIVCHDEALLKKIMCCKS
jgi:hypothetical protein